MVSSIWKSVWHRKYLYLMLLPLLIYLLVFHYLPMVGVVIAFKNFNPLKGIFGSPWAGLKHFERVFRMSKFMLVLRNTLTISVLRLLFGFPFPIIISIMMYELRSKKAQRLVQNAVCLPEFISWVVMGGILTNLLSVDHGIINQILSLFGIKPIPFLSSDKTFVPVMIVSMIWKTFGWNTIIYMASLLAIPSDLYEAAIIDGASRFRRIWHITLPGIRGMIFTLLIIRIGGLMKAGFEQIFVMYHPGVYKVADILDTFVFRLGLQDGKFEMATAIGLFTSLISFLLIIIANSITRSMGEHGIY